MPALSSLAEHPKRVSSSSRQTSSQSPKHTPTWFRLINKTARRRFFFNQHSIAIWWVQIYCRILRALAFSTVKQCVILPFISCQFLKLGHLVMHGNHFRWWCKSGSVLVQETRFGIILKNIPCPATFVLQMNTLYEVHKSCSLRFCFVKRPIIWLSYPILLFQTLNGLSEESSTERLEFPLLTQRSLSSITQLLPFLRTLCCSFQSPPPYSNPTTHFPVADYPAASSEAVLKKLECITEDEFLDSMEN